MPYMSSKCGRARQKCHHQTFPLKQEEQAYTQKNSTKLVLVSFLFVFLVSGDFLPVCEALFALWVILLSCLCCFMGVRKHCVEIYRWENTNTVKAFE